MRIRPKIAEDRTKAFKRFEFLMFKQEKPFDITQPRSNPQNALMWLWLTFIEKQLSETGDVRTKEYWYCWLMLQYPIFFEESQVPKSSSMFDKEEMQMFLNDIDRHANVVWGFELPDPNEKKARDWFIYHGYDPEGIFYEKTWHKSL